MKTFPFFLLLMISVAISGCATTKRSTLLGAGIGAATGAGAGALVHPGPAKQDRIQNIFVGAAISSLLGAGIGYLFHDDKKEATSSSVVGASTYSGGPGDPQLIPAQVETHFVDDQVKGGTFVPGHFQYRIKQPTQWKK